jgi:hypothetical protein
MWNSPLKNSLMEYITLDELLAASHLQGMSQFQPQLGVIRKKNAMRIFHNIEESV